MPQQLLYDLISLECIISHFNSKCVFKTNVNRLLFRLPLINLNLFLKIKSSHRVTRLKAGRVCAQTNSAQSDVTNRRYCAISAALRTRLSDLNTASLASPGRLAARGALEERSFYTRSGDISIWMSALRRCAGARDETPGWRQDALSGIYTAVFRSGRFFLVIARVSDHKEVHGKHAGR